MLFRRTLLLTAAAALTAIGLGGPAAAEDQFITVQSTTSTQSSGLYDHILPVFKDLTGIEVRVVAVGTGQAIKNSQNGDGDVMLVHHTPSELKFIAGGYGVQRFDVMYNDFVIVGPGGDPAGVAGMNKVDAALTKISTSGAPFASRGDDSGTHKKELSLWRTAGIDVSTASGGWYRETGSGMGATLNAAVGMGAYAMTDRSTWLNFGNKGDYKILVEGDSRMFNQYGVIMINPAMHKNVKTAPAQAFIDWLVSAHGQETIASYQIKGQQAFFPNAK